MGTVIEVDTNRFIENGKPPRTPRRVTDPTARAPIGATVEDLAAAIHSAVIIPGEPEQAIVMRRHLRMMAGAQRREIPTIESLTSELFNNAIKHTKSGDAGGEITLVIIKLPGRIQVKVIDQGPRPGKQTKPHVRPVETDGYGHLVSEGGFGLRLVDVDATRWGVVEESRRNTVWFEVERFNNADRA